MVLADRIRYVERMKTRISTVCLAAALLAGATLMVLADAKPNPYQSIIDRNAFALKPPPPPPDPAAALPPPPPPSNVKLTGITSMFGPSSKRAMLEIVETGPGKLPKKPTLREGEAEGSVEVVSIDVEKGLVKIKNNGIEAIIGFTNEVAKAGPVAGVPYQGAPAVPPATTSFMAPGAAASGGNVAVPVPGASGGSGRSTVAMSSGGGATSSGVNTYGSIPGGATSLGGTQPGAYTGVGVSSGNTVNSTVPDYSKIPTRNLRVPTATTTSTDGSAPARPQYTQEQIALIIEAQRMRQPNLPFPPTILNPRPGPVGQGGTDQAGQ